MLTDFARHVAEGLAAPQAYLSSRFIYDERGSALFREIMALDEYYLTRAETEILTREAGALVRLFGGDGGRRPVEIVELGAGDGSKTELLLREGLRQNVPLTYRPVDISGDILRVLTGRLADRLPALRVDPIEATYDAALARLRASATRVETASGADPAGVPRRVVLFLGSNIGNFDYAAARAFCAGILGALRPGDLFVMGVDLRKDPRRILRAYDDARGVTARFNLNLLHRVNRELGGAIDVAQWGFYPLYNPESGEVRSYLYPRSEQRVTLPELGVDRAFAPGEVIHTEVSRKYLPRELAALAAASGGRVVADLRDARGDFADVVWEVLA